MEEIQKKILEGLQIIMIKGFPPILTKSEKKWLNEIDNILKI